PIATRLAWGTIAGDVYLEDPATEGTLRLQHGPAGATRSLAFSPDGRILAVAGQGQAVRLWDVETGTELSGQSGFELGRCIGSSRAGNLLATGDSGHEGRRGAVTIWDWEGPRRLTTFHGHSGGINVLAFAPDGSWLASGDSAGIVKVRDVT